MIDNISWKNNKSYALVSNTLVRVEIDEPINEENANRNIYERDDKSKGFLRARSNDLEFSGNAIDAIREQIYTKGIAEDLILEKRIKSDNRIDELWRTTEPIYLDLAELKFDDKKGGGSIAKTKAVEGGLKKIIDSRISDVYDLKTLVDADGNTIDPLSTESVFLEAREIFLRSVLSVEDGVVIAANVGGFWNNDGTSARAIPFKTIINSDRDNIDSVLGDKLRAANQTYANLSLDTYGNCFLTASIVPKRLTINGKVKVTIINGDTGSMAMDLVYYKDGTDFVYDASRKVSLDTSSTVALNDIMEFTFNDFVVDVRAGDSLSIGLLSIAEGTVGYQVSETQITIIEDSVFPSSNAPALTYKQTLNRLLYIITGRNNLVDSELLTTGELSGDLLSNGFWIRNFPDIINEGTDEERATPFNVSLEQVLSHIEALLPKAWWTEKKGLTEYLRLEEYAYTQRDTITIPFGEKDAEGNIIYVEASDIKREVLGKNFYSNIEIGSEKGGDDYEEVNGLRSVTGKAYFSTINKNNDSTYSKLSPFRLGDVDVELPRRKPYELYPEEDTRYDSDIMCIRCRKVGNSYVVNKWQDVPYETAPTGIYRPNSAYNLDISPARLVLKHGSNINSALYHYPIESLVFASSNCNSSFKSKIAGQATLSEDGLIPHSILDKPTVRPFSLDCNAPVSQELEDIITGSTNGINNWFGIVALKTGVDIEYFRLIKSDVNKEGKHKFIEATL